MCLFTYEREIAQAGGVAGSGEGEAGSLLGWSQEPRILTWPEGRCATESPGTPGDS